MVTFLWRASGCPEPNSKTTPFTDVNEQAYHYKAVLWALENGITTGTSATAFSPSEECSRAQMATFLYRCAGSPVAVGEINFSDIVAYSYYEDAVIWAAGNGITNGTGNNEFSPDVVCTRGQIASFLYRYFAE